MPQGQVIEPSRGVPPSPRFVPRPLTDKLIAVRVASKRSPLGAIICAALIVLALADLAMFVAGVGAWSTYRGAFVPAPGLQGHTLQITTGTVTPLPTQPPQVTLPRPPALEARAAILLNLRTGQILYGKRLLTELPMASTTKIMTAVVALTHGQLDQRITVGADAVAIQGTGASVAGLRQGDVLTLRDLLYALLLPSGDDAAVVIADGIGGSQTQFVAMMNQEAATLGLSETHYANAHGLDAPGHYTTVRDLAILARYAMTLPVFPDVVRTALYQLPATSDHQAYTWTTTDRMLTDMPYAGITGIKTGFTGNAGACLVFSATRAQGQLLGVVLGEPDETARFTEAAKLLDWGFAVEKLTAQPANILW